MGVSTAVGRSGVSTKGGGELRKDSDIRGRVDEGWIKGAGVLATDGELVG